MIEKAKKQELIHKLKTGWNVLWGRYGYYDYRIEITLLTLFGFFFHLLFLNYAWINGWYQ